MLVFWEQRLAFLATPKTASTAIEAALESLAAVAIQRPPPLKHLPAALYRRHLAPLLEARAGAPFTVVALIREPVDWLGSWYRFRLREDLDDPATATQGLTFEAFVRGYLGSPRPAFADVGSQADFLLDADGRLGVDRLFRYEALGEFVRFLEDRLDCAIQLPNLMVSPAGALDLAPATRRALAEALARDRALHAAAAGQG